MGNKPTSFVNNISLEIKLFAIVFSILLHLLAILVPFSITQNSLTLRNVGIENGVKTTQLYLKKKSERHGEDLNLSTLNTLGRPQPTRLQSASTPTLPVLGEFSLPEPNRSGIGLSAQKKSPNVLFQKMKGSDINVPQGVRFSEKSKHAFDGSMFDVGIILPEGIKEDELNRFEEMFFSFRRRITEQYINQILRLSTEVEDRHPRTIFPWTNKTQILKAKLTYDIQGNLERIEFLQKTDAKILQEFYQEVMNSMNKIPNPPTAIINQEEKFELIFGLNIIE